MYGGHQVPTHKRRPTGRHVADPVERSGQNVVTVTLNGTGASAAVPAIGVSPLSVPFRPPGRGGLSPLQNLTVRNNGLANLTLGAISVGGPNPSQFVKTTAKDFCPGQTLGPTRDVYGGRQIPTCERRPAERHLADPV